MKSIMSTPSVPHSCVQPSVWDADSLGPLHQCQRFAVVRQQSVVSAIVGLCLACRPSAVLRRVVSRRIESVYAVGRTWARPHVIGKRLKRFAPPLADLYPPASIVLIRLMCWAVTACQHVLPSLPKPGDGLFSVDVGGSRDARLFPVNRTLFLGEASARLHVSSFEFGGVGNTKSSAIASARPSCSTTAGICSAGNNQKPSKAQPDQIRWRSTNRWCGVHAF